MRDSFTFWLIWAVPCLALALGAALAGRWDWCTVGLIGAAFTTILALISAPHDA